MPNSVEAKSIISDIANKFIKIFEIDKFREIINQAVNNSYSEGLEKAKKDFNIEIEFRNKEKDLPMINQYVFDNIKGMTDEMQDKLRGELQRGMMNNETQDQLRKRVSNVFRGSNPTRFNYEDRIRTIVRTEKMRALNMAYYNSVQTTEDKRKRISTGNDPCPECKRLENLGLVKMEQQFNHEGNKAQYPPFHPNCRCALIIEQVK